MEWSNFERGRIMRLRKAGNSYWEIGNKLWQNPRHLLGITGPQGKGYYVGKKLNTKYRTTSFSIVGRVFQFVTLSTASHLAVESGNGIKLCQATSLDFVKGPMTKKGSPKTCWKARNSILPGVIQHLPTEYKGGVQFLMVAGVYEYSLRDTCKLRTKTTMV